MKPKVKIRKILNADGLIKILREEFRKIQDHRKKIPKISLPDCLMSGLAIFALKYPSLLSFDERKDNDRNLRKVYKIGKAPSDTHMREILDKVKPNLLYSIFGRLFSELQRGKDLLKFLFLGEYYLISGDGTGYFSSSTVHCENCLEKKNNKTGEIKCYHHQFYGLCLVHPDQREVIPFSPEAIIKQDGDNKNDCERNASKRCLERFRRNHPHLKAVLVEDGLASNAPHIRTLQELDIRFLLGAKEGDHKYLFEYVKKEEEKGNVKWHEETDAKGSTHKFRFIENVPLNGSNKDLKVNFLEHWETTKKGKVIHFSWVTDLPLTPKNLYQIMRGARARWKIENETFNTLKNQGYNFEHNFGHGYKNLSTVFALLMMLAFLVDQIQQIACPLFRAAWKKMGSKRALWEDIRALFNNMIVDSMTDVLAALYYGFEKQVLKANSPP